MSSSPEAKKRGPNVTLIVIIGIIVLTLGSIATMAAISVHHGVADGYIAPEDR